MNFIDDFTQKLTKAGQSAVQKTKDFAEIAKLNSRISEEEKRKNEIYSQIGKLYCSKYSEIGEPEFAELVASISESEKKINELNEQIKTLKGSAKCANCGADLTAGMKFCGVCGTSVSESAATEASQPESEFTVRHCPSCGAATQNNDIFCAECGARL